MHSEQTVAHSEQLTVPDIVQCQRGSHLTAVWVRDKWLSSVIGVSFLSFCSKKMVDQFLLFGIKKRDISTKDFITHQSSATPFLVVHAYLVVQLLYIARGMQGIFNCGVLSLCWCKVQCAGQGWSCGCAPRGVPRLTAHEHEHEQLAHTAVHACPFPSFFGWWDSTRLLATHWCNHVYSGWYTTPIWIIILCWCTSLLISTMLPRTIGLGILVILSFPRPHLERGKPYRIFLGKEIFPLTGFMFYDKITMGIMSTKWVLTPKSSLIFSG